MAAPAPGTAIVGTTTIDALTTTALGTRSGGLGAASYRWLDLFTVQVIFAANTTPDNYTMATIKFESRPQYPLVLSP
jgi:hypothetical protein